jgi:Tfp pilus assembly protein PilF
VLESQPENVDARLQLGLSLAARRRFGDARKEFVRVLEKTPEYHDARLGLARIAFWQGRIGEAERELDALRKRAPHNAEAKALAEQIARAKAPPRERRTARANPAAQAAPRPNVAPPASTQRSARAVAPPGRAIPLQTGFERQVLHGRALRRAGRFPESERIFPAAVARVPGDADIWTDLGPAIAFQGRFAEARPPFERALALNPRAYDAILGLARLDLYTDALTRADARVDQVLAAVPDYRTPRP